MKGVCFIEDIIISAWFQAVVGVLVSCADLTTLAVGESIEISSVLYFSFSAALVLISFSLYWCITRKVSCQLLANFFCQFFIYLSIGSSHGRPKKAISTIEWNRRYKQLASNILFLINRVLF